MEEGSDVQTPVGSELEGSDPDVGQDLAYSITSGNSNGFFKISRCSGQVSVIKEGLDFETTNVYTLGIELEDDAQSPLSDTTVLTIRIINRNEPPAWARTDYSFEALEGCTDGADLSSNDTRVLAEDGDAGQEVSYSISRNDRDTFEIDSKTGVITVADWSQLDYEIAGSRSFSIEVEASDGQESVKQSVSISVANVNEAPEVLPESLAALTIDEGGSAGTVVGTAMATDPEGSTSITWSLHGTDAAYF